MRGAAGERGGPDPCTRPARTHRPRRPGQGPPGEERGGRHPLRALPAAGAGTPPLRARRARPRAGGSQAGRGRRWRPLPGGGPGAGPGGRRGWGRGGGRRGGVTPSFALPGKVSRCCRAQPRLLLLLPRPGGGDCAPTSARAAPPRPPARPPAWPPPPPAPASPTTTSSSRSSASTAARRPRGPRPGPRRPGALRLLAPPPSPAPAAAAPPRPAPPPAFPARRLRGPRAPSAPSRSPLRALQQLPGLLHPAPPRRLQPPDRSWAPSSPAPPAPCGRPSSRTRLLPVPSPPCAGAHTAPCPTSHAPGTQDPPGPAAPAPLRRPGVGGCWGPAPPPAGAASRIPAPLRGCAAVPPVPSPHPCSGPGSRARRRRIPLPSALSWPLQQPRPPHPHPQRRAGHCSPRPARPPRRFQSWGVRAPFWEGETRGRDHGEGAGGLWMRPTTASPLPGPAVEPGCSRLQAVGGGLSLTFAPFPMVEGDFSLRGFYPLPNLSFPSLQLFLLRAGQGLCSLPRFSWPDCRAVL